MKFFNVLNFIAQEDVPTFTNRSCSDTGSGLSIPTWYKYLRCDGDQPQIDKLTDAWAILAGVIEITLFVVGISAVFIMAYGGIEFIMSQGQPDRLTRARNILLYSSIGLAIAIISSALVQLIMDGFINNSGFIN